MGADDLRRQPQRAGGGPVDAVQAFRPSLLSGTSLLLSFPTVAGRTYRLQQNRTLAAGAWVAVPGVSAITGNNAVRSFILPTTGENNHYRVQVSR